MAAVRFPPLPPRPSVPPFFPSNLERFSDYGQITRPSWQMAPVRLLVLATSHFLMKSSGLAVDLLQIKLQKRRQKLLQPSCPDTKPPLPPFFIFLLGDPANWRQRPRRGKRRPLQ